MVKLFAKMFIKDYKNVQNEKVRTKYGEMAGGFGIITNLILVIMKLVVGIITASISIIADGINNLSDMGSSILTIIGFKISSKPADKKHPFGHQRMEYIIGLIVSMIILFVGFELLISSVKKIISPEEMSTNYIAYIILGVAILLKVIQGVFYLSTAKTINSLSLKATAKDSINDCISTFVVLVGLIVSSLVNYNLDGVFGSLVSLFILYSGFGIIKEAISPLLGEAPNKDLINNIVKEVSQYEGVYGIHDIIAHLYGPSKVFISLHAEVDAKENVLKSHELIDLIEQDIKHKFDCEIVIHMDPIVRDDPLINEVKEKLNASLKEIDENLKYHDLRMVKGENRTNVIFDIVIPYEIKIDEDKITEIISKKIKEIDEKYVCVINFDNDFIGE